MSINYTELKEVIERDMIPKSVLEQIRAEIEQYNRKPSHYPVNTISIETVLQIIDKYKEEQTE